MKNYSNSKKLNINIKAVEYILLLFFYACLCVFILGDKITIM